MKNGSAILDSPVESTVHILTGSYVSYQERSDALHITASFLKNDVCRRLRKGTPWGNRGHRCCRRLQSVLDL